jgi:hypothetical protein
VLSRAPMLSRITAMSAANDHVHQQRVGEFANARPTISCRVGNCGKYSCEHVRSAILRVGKLLPTLGIDHGF